MSQPDRYQVRLTPRAVRALADGLPPAVAAACIEFVHGPLTDNPRRVGKPLRDELAGYFSARRGTYRIVYAIDDTAHVITVYRIDHRRYAYGS